CRSSKFYVSVLIIIILGSVGSVYKIFHPKPVFGESTIETEKQKLLKLKTTINEQIEKIQKKQFRKLKHLREFSEIDFAIALKRKNIFLSELMLEKLEKDIHSVQAEIGKLKLTKQYQQEYYKKRIKDLYKISRQPLLALLLSKESMHDIYLQLEYLQMLVKKDQHYVKDYEKLVKFWFGKKQAMETMKMDAVVSRQEIWPQKEGLQNDLDRREQFLSNLKENPDVYHQFLDELKQSNEIFHSQISEMKCNPEGLGLAEIVSKRELLFPVDINLLKNPKKYWLKDRLHPVGGGIEFFLPEGTPVYSVGAGITCFSDWFIGFGNVVVIDHGQNWFSVYIHCSSLQVENGDVIEPGQLIAYVGDSSSLRGFAMYFELIHDNMLISPMESFGIKF
ncbi:MAG: hypothetical protein A2161_04675, partial [Candidatus Schekmanbacteria bacterium RBG_13_48_7]